MPPPQVGSFSLKRENNERHSIGYAFVEGDVESLTELTLLLSTQEQQQLESFEYPRRKNSYCLGRVSAKLAMQQILTKADLNTITVDNGVFGFPVVKGVQEKIQVSISHSDGLGVALAHFEEHPVGIDIERIDPDKTSVIETCLSNDEITLIKKKLMEPYGNFVFWTIKEALSKILKTGLMLDFKYMQIGNLEKVKEGVWISHFSSFSQYRAISFTTQHYVGSVVLPAKSTFELPDLFALANAFNRFVKR
ncbi:4'-phosphopantetheinyl transferase family protein [Rapidithrix thailandica]